MFCGSLSLGAKANCPSVTIPARSSESTSRSRLLTELAVENTGHSPRLIAVGSIVHTKYHERMVDIGFSTGMQTPPRVPWVPGHFTIHLAFAFPRSCVCGPPRWPYGYGILPKVATNDPFHRVYWAPRIRASWDREELVRLLNSLEIEAHEIEWRSRWSAQPASQIV